MRNAPSGSVIALGAIAILLGLVGCAVSVLSLAFSELTIVDVAESALPLLSVLGGAGVLCLRDWGRSALLWYVGLTVFFVVFHAFDFATSDRSLSFDSPIARGIFWAIIGIQALQLVWCVVIVLVLTRRPVIAQFPTTRA